MFLMNNCYLGIDIGSISTKGVVIDEKNNIIASSYIWTEGNPIQAVKNVLKELKSNIDNTRYIIKAVGTTGSARKLIGTILNAQVIKNEITAHAIGTISRFPDVKTIFEIGGQDSKIILIDNGIVVDYAMNTLCAAGTGSFLSSQAKRLGVDINDFGKFALKSNNPSKLAARCTVFAESDLVHKAQIGHKKEDIIAGLCNAVVDNYLNNVGKGKQIKAPIVFQGGVSKNVGVIKAFEKATNNTVSVDENGHLMGCLGIAILAKDSKKEQDFNFNISDIDFKTNSKECDKCPNNCEVIYVMENDNIIDFWGNRCDNGKRIKK